MSQTVTVDCPKCEEELTVSWWTESHYVHNGIGQQKVAEDRHRKISDHGDCECELTDDQIDDLFSQASKNYNDSREDYGDYKYDMLKDEGRL